MLDTDKKQPLRRARWLSGLALGAMMLAPAAQAETLQDALSKAYENNPTLTGARAGLDAGAVVWGYAPGGPGHSSAQALRALGAVRVFGDMAQLPQLLGA